jgi:RHS repeat-associated protein
LTNCFRAQGCAGSNYTYLTQKERDTETGLDYFLARYYSSTQGRFTSVDPVNYQARLNKGDPQSWNGYAYVNNNPLTHADRDGRGIKNFFKKFWNWLAWDVWGDSADVQVEENRRRNDLMRNADKDGGVNIMSPITGQWVRVYPMELSRANVWLWSGAVYYWQEQGGGYRRMTPAELASVIDIKVYRGGPSIEVRDIDVKIQDGLVQPTRGPSVNLDPAKVEKFGGAYRVDGLPDELQLIQKGTRDPGHYEIVPRNPMPLERFVELLKKVKLVQD